MATPKTKAKPSIEVTVSYQSDLSSFEENDRALALVCAPGKKAGAASLVGSGIRVLEFQFNTKTARRDAVARLIALADYNGLPHEQGEDWFKFGVKKYL